MATKIRGLTTDLSLNTTKFQQGIRAAGKQTTVFKENLKKINKQLQLRPTSMVLLKNKTSLLNREIKNSSVALKAAQNQFKNLKLAGLDTTKVSAVVKRLGTNISSLNHRLALTKKRFGEIANQRLNRGIAVTGSIVAAATHKFGGFQKGVGKVASISKTTDIQGLADQALNLSNALGVDATSILEGWYQALSSGIKESKGFTNELEFMTTAAKLSKTGFGDMGDVVKLLSTTMNNFGLSASQAADQFLQLQQQGIITTGQMAETFSNVLPLARNLGISLADVNATIGAYSRQGIEAAQSTTLLKSLFTSLIKDSSKASQVFRRQSGRTFQQFIKDGGNIGQALKLIASSAEAQAQGLSNIFTNVRALQASVAFDAKEYTAQLQGQANAVGALDEAHKKQDGLLTYQKVLVQLSNAFTKIGQGVSEILLPHLKQFTEWLSDNTENIKKLGEIIVQVFIALLAGKVIAIVAKFVSGIKLITGVIWGMNTALLSNPVVLIIKAIIIAIVGLMAFFPKLRNAVFSLVGNILKILAPVAELLSHIVNMISFIFGGIGSIIGGAWNAITGQPQTNNQTNNTTINNTQLLQEDKSEKKSWDFNTNSWDSTNNKLGEEI